MTPIFFSSEYADTETGLVYYNYRYYSPALGRWLARDPIEEQGGLNLYGFCTNNPLTSTDSLGLWNLWNVATWGVPNGIGWSTWNSLNPSHESAGWSGAIEGALAGNAAFWDGVIPFADPFHDQYDSCENSTKWSKGIGQATRDIELTLVYGFARVPAQLTHYTTAAGARGIAQTGSINSGWGIFGKGVYMTSIGRPVNLFVPAASTVPVQVATPAWTARIIPKLVYLKWGNVGVIP